MAIFSKVEARLHQIYFSLIFHKIMHYSQYDRRVVPEKEHWKESEQL